MERIVVVPVSEMDDESLMKHMERRHADELKMEFTREPDQPVRRLHASEPWRTYHNTLHRLYPAAHDHRHRDVVRGS